MICPACWSENEERAEVCEVCGASLQQALASSEAPSEGASGDSPEMSASEPAPAPAGGEEPGREASQPLSEEGGPQMSEWGGLPQRSWDEAPQEVEAGGESVGPARSDAWSAGPGGGDDGGGAGRGETTFGEPPGPGRLLLRSAAYGALAFLLTLLVAQVVVFLSFLTGGTSVGELAKVGGVLFYGFHHVGLQAEFPTFDLSQIAGAQGFDQTPGLDLGAFDVSYTVAAALLLGTILVGFLLFRAGRRVADESGGSIAARLLYGASVAVPYAFLSLLLSFAVSFEPDLGQPAEALFGAGGTVSVGISAPAALLWPLLIGVIAGVLGGFSSAGPILARERWGGRAIAIVKGGGWMLLYVSGVAFVGLLVLAATSPSATADYFSQVTSGREGLALLLFTILAAPNMAIFGLALGMGSSVAFGNYVGGTSLTVLSLTQFPQGLDLASLTAGAGSLGSVDGLEAAQLPFQTGNAPAAYFFFILAPLVGAILGGRAAARAAGASSRGEGAAMGAAAGGVFALGALLLAILAGIGLKIDVSFAGIDQTVLARLGPQLIIGTVLAVVWGVAGGALGGATWRGGGAPLRPRGRAPRAGAAVEGSGFETPEGFQARAGAGLGFEPSAGAGSGFESLAGAGPGFESPGAPSAAGPEPTEQMPATEDRAGEPVGARVGAAGTAPEGQLAPPAPDAAPASLGPAGQAPEPPPAPVGADEEPPAFDLSIPVAPESRPPAEPESQLPVVPLASREAGPEPTPEPAPEPSPEAAKEADPAADWLPPELSPDQPKAAEPQPHKLDPWAALRPQDEHGAEPAGGPEPDGLSDAEEQGGAPPENPPA